MLPTKRDALLRLMAIVIVWAVFVLVVEAIPAVLDMFLSPMVHP